MFMWVLLIFFAFDNVMGWLASPFLFYPIMLILAVIGMLYSMGMGQLIFPVVRQAVNMGLRSAGVPF